MDAYIDEMASCVLVMSSTLPFGENNSHLRVEAQHTLNVNRAHHNVGRMLPKQRTVISHHAVEHGDLNRRLRRELWQKEID